MEAAELQAHSFVVRLWLEEVDSERYLWRGHITHVLTHERCYFDDLSVVSSFIQSFLRPGSVKTEQADG